MTFTGFFRNICEAKHKHLAQIKAGSETYKDIMQAIAEHGSEVVEVVSPSYLDGKTIKKERVLIVLEMLFQKASQSGNLGAAQQYLDRMLGRPKESLNLTNGSDLISKLSDEELTDKITSIIETAREGAAGKAD